MPALRWFSQGAVGPAMETEDLHHRYASAHQFGGHYAPLALLTGELDLPMRHVFPLLEQPSLIICGEDDPHHPPEEMEDLAILNPRADLDVLPGVGTTVLEENPGDVLHLIDLWVKASTLADVSDYRVEDVPPPPPTGESDAPEPRMGSPKQPSDSMDLDVPEVPIVTDASADSKSSPKIQDPIQDPIQDQIQDQIQAPREQRPTTRAARRNDPTSVSTRVPPRNASGSSGSQGSARSTSSGSTARKRSSSRSRTSGESKQE
jgi:hypothetical protein